MPAGGRYPHSTEKPTSLNRRPWALRFARVPDSTGAVTVPSAFYDHQRQVTVSDDGGLLTCMANTHTPTIPDGSITNPPPLDEGPKD
ncbi:putative ATP-grasp-modified RiPP [Kitasatospora kifunensis]|uniref:Putative ATP-grasp target RiPP n=1 Tax=Kitasatospora kifunensis TaxID=58351 RepID=A0A7W7R9D1_KITKI|nr:putative ATP-grasp-modified RiPP [Kitasatospora kifunensis]MBB4927744.1 putative ATP-grasp target RiPP [Kitasatospora kifunensis]